jgi:hypothetical protein
MRKLLWIILGTGIVLGSFFGTLFVIDHVNLPFFTVSPSSIRATHAQQLKTALENHKKARGGYPVFPDNPISDLKAALVDSKYLASIPVDPVSGKQYRYVSDGNVYGMLFSLDSGAPCLVGASGRGFWGNPPVCPFQ